MIEQHLVNTLNLQLCGSRYFNAKAPELVPVSSATDWDYFAQYTPYTESVLLRSGFERMTTLSTDYTDALVHCILYKDNCQVVLRTDAVLYNAVHTSIAPEFFAAYLWKSNPEGTVNRVAIRAIYEQLYAVAGQI